jgi:hypothetical protein
VSSPVIGFRFANPGNVPTSQKKMNDGVQAGVTVSCCDQDWHAGNVAVIKRGITVAACTGWTFSAMPPITSDRATTATRHNLKKTATQRYFPKFDILI